MSRMFSSCFAPLPPMSSPQPLPYTGMHFAVFGQSLTGMFRPRGERLAEREAQNGCANESVINSKLLMIYVRGGYIFFSDLFYRALSTQPFFFSVR